MKILRIRLKNINSLKGEHTIDFREEPLLSAGLFAITGPTGSGKSTILDVITLALFNRIPRVSEPITKSFIERSGLVLTRNMQDALAEVTYSCNDGIFTSRWSISKNKKGNLRDYELQIADEQGKLFDLKKSEVPAQNETLTGLSFDQFVKAIILAQGDFAAFLKARKDERGKLLEKITGTWIYRELGKAAFEKNKNLGQELVKLQDQHRIQQDQLLPEDNYKTMMERLKLLEAELEIIEKEGKELSEQLKIKNEIQKLSEIISKIENGIKEEKQFLQEFTDLNGERLNRHTRLQPWQKQLWEWQNQNSKLDEQNRKSEQIKLDLKKCQQEDEQIKEEVKSLTGSDDEVVDALNQLEQKVLDLQQKLANDKTLITSTVKAIKAESKNMDLTLDWNDPTKSMNQLKQIKQKDLLETDQIKSTLSSPSIENPDGDIALKNRIVDDLQTLVSEKKLLQSSEKQLADLVTELTQHQEDFKPMPDQLSQLRTEQKQADLTHKNLEKQKRIRDLEASLEEHRQKLVDGKPCPLCGALHHPYSEEMEKMDDELENQIIEAHQNNELLKKQISKLDTLLSEKEKAITRLSNKKSDLEKTVKEYQNSCNEIEQDIPEVYDTHQPEAEVTKLKKEIEKIGQYKILVDRQEKLDSLMGKAVEWENHFQSAARLEAQIKEIFPGKDISITTRDLRQRFVVNNTKTENLTNARKKLEEEHLELKNTFDSLTSYLKNELEEYSTPRDALKDLMDTSEFARLKDEKDRMEKKISDLGSELKVHLQNQEEKKKNEPKDSVEEMNRRIETLRIEFQKLRSERDDLVGKKQFQIKTLETLANLEVQISEQKKQNEKWVLLNKYIGDSEGKKFSTFAQELTLLQLVKKASKRLEMLNNRYLLSLPSDDEDDSLAIIDTHMGDMRRSVKSLSGGETFQVSLSLALALSDLAAHKIEIGSLFIDEGFGSLDKLTLDQTMDTLEKLQYETNKTIGVISHVEAMQERIATQIKLQKGGQGYSGMEVV